MCFGGGSGGADTAAANARYEEQFRQDKITTGQNSIANTFSQFDDNFYNGRQKAYSDYASPQLDEQFGKARKQLIYALADGHVLNSSVATNRLGDLEREYGRKKIEVADQARGYANQARSDVEQARSGLMSQLFASADYNAAANQSINSARTLTAQPTFNAPGAYFQNVTAGLAAGQGGQPLFSSNNGQQPQKSGTQLFAAGGQAGAGRVVN